MLTILSRLSGVEWRHQGPAFLIGIGHGGTHWVAAVFYIVLPFITRDLGLSYAQAGTLVAVFHASAALANFGSGLLVDVSGRRVIYQVVSLLMGAGALFAFGVTAEYLALCLLTVLIGVSNNLWHPAAIAYVSETYPANRGYALSIHALGANVGDTLAPPATGAMLAYLTWQSTSMAGAVPAILIAFLIGALLLKNDGHGATGQRERMGMAAYLGGLKALFRNRAVLGLCLMAGFRSMTQNGLYVFLPLYLINVMETGPVLMGLAVMAMQMGGIVAAPVAGAWSDRIGRRPVVLAGLTTTTLVIIALTLIHHELLFIVGVSLLGFALFAVRPVVHSWMLDITPNRWSGSATSLMFGTQAVFSAGVPVVGGIMADHYGLAVVFYLLAGTMLVANVLVYLLPGEDPAARTPA
ncbi:MAG: MFS transporter [Gammaproteobacteria bacterium]|nr:MFS transporter [Gammaproteobacteria bacterium]